jgi:hypothetical protein
MLLQAYPIYQKIKMKNNETDIYEKKDLFAKQLENAIYCSNIERIEQIIQNNINFINIKSKYFGLHFVIIYYYYNLKQDNANTNNKDDYSYWCFRNEQKYNYKDLLSKEIGIFKFTF